MSEHDAKTREPRLFPWADDQIEAVVKADFLAFCIYRGYNDDVRRLEWERMRNIEVGRFKRRLAALLGPRVLPPDACPAHGHGEPCFYCGDLCNCWTGNPGLWPLMLPVDPARQGRTVPVHMKCVLTRLGIGKPAPTDRDELIAALEEIAKMGAGMAGDSYYSLGYDDGVHECAEIARAALAKAKEHK